MPEGNVDDETYSVIYAALKHPIRRRILRMLQEGECTYTQLLNSLDLDTGHLNYHLESLGELLAKSDDGKYRLSEFGIAAVKLMVGVEETQASQVETKIRSSKRKLFHLSQIIAVVALILVGLFLMNISYFSTYHCGASGVLDQDNLRIIQPNGGQLQSFDNINARNFPTDTLTTHYHTFFQIEIAYTNVSLRIQLTERISPEGGGFPPELDYQYIQYPTLIYDETWVGPLDKANVTEKNAKHNYVIKVPIKSPQEKGFLVSNSFVYYTTTLTNLGAQMIERDSSGKSEWVTYPDNTGSLCLQTSYPVIEKTDYPYFYHGISLFVMAAIIAVLPYLPAVARKITKK